MAVRIKEKMYIEGLVWLLARVGIRVIWFLICSHTDGAPSEGQAVGWVPREQW